MVFESVWLILLESVQKKVILILKNEKKSGEFVGKLYWV